MNEKHVVIEDHWRVTHIPAQLGFYTVEIGSGGDIIKSAIVAWELITMKCSRENGDISYTTSATPITYNGALSEPNGILDPNGKVSVPDESTMFDDIVSFSAWVIRKRNEKANHNRPAQGPYCLLPEE